MAAKFEQALLASPPAPAFKTGSASARTLPLAPPNVRLENMLSRSLSGSRVPSPSSIRRRVPFVMVIDASGAKFFFPAAWGHLPEILGVENVGPRPVKPGEVPSTTVALETFGVTVLKKWS